MERAQPCVAYRLHFAQRMCGWTRKNPIGAEIATTPEAGVHFRVWAPAATKIAVVIDAPEPRELALAAEPDGYAAGFVPGLGAGTRYRFQIDDRALVADPASRFQPEGPFGPSQVIDPGTFAWTDHAWRGIEAHRHVVYELHVGTFTPAGTWAAATAELAFLKTLGITTIELMPIAEFDGTYNWGYDGVDLFAPAHVYGDPTELRRFVDRAHALGLAVILDVVYNHVGPSGSTLGTFAPGYFRRDRGNEWGDALDFGSAQVREFYLENAAYWIREFHMDGLRLDATQAIHDSSEPHILAELVTRVRAAAPGRRVWIVGENESQDAALLRDFGLDALWNDDFHHTARVAATGVIDGYLHDYTGSAHELVAAIRHGFLYQGQMYPWQRNPRGTGARGLSRARFVHFLENHDQVANLGFGERLGDVTDPATLRALTAVLLLTPSVPMLFQGQETGSRQPWVFFCDYRGDLAASVRRGRARFVAQFQRLATAEAQAACRDPCARTTFSACVLDPAERDFARPLVALHRDLLDLRRDDPAFTDPRDEAMDAAAIGDHAFVVRYFGEAPAADRLLVVNLGRTLRRATIAEPLIAPPAGTGWRVRWSSEDPRYGGHGTPPPFSRERLAIPAHAAVLFAPDPAASLRQDPPPPSGDRVPVDP
jgi:maltooligosyltrehalose trehalohydrolase